MGRASVTSPLQDHRYLMLGTLGRGGLGEVHRAFDRTGRRLVAIKTADALSDEFAALSKLSHPNVVRAYELRTAKLGPLPPGSPYLVMEHVDGVRADEALPPGRTRPRLLVSFAVELLRGLAHVHEAGMVHRDLKPANVLVRRVGSRIDSVKLTDFGLAVPEGSAERPGTISGSPLYVAPETLLGAPVDGRADLYAAGLLLYRLATGENAAPATDIDAALRWHLSGPPADPTVVRPRLPDRLARLIRSLTTREPGRRAESAESALSVLGVPEPVFRRSRIA